MTMTEADISRLLAKLKSYDPLANMPSPELIDLYEMAMEFGVDGLPDPYREMIEEAEKNFKEGNLPPIIK